MSYQAAIDRLYALAAELHTLLNIPQRKFRLEDMRILLAALGDPHYQFPSILIAGTNGKGSTAATLASILEAAGYHTGLYTSPHLARPNERIQIGSHPISNEDFANLYFAVESAARDLVDSGKLPAPPSFFETITAMAFLHFAGGPTTGPAESGCPILPTLGEDWVCEASVPSGPDPRHPNKPVDIAILEVGLGGRLDATNVVEPILSILTDISLDHTEWLGPTITAIAREKAGILRANGIMVTLPQHPEASNAVGEAATALNVSAINAAKYLPVDRPHDHGAPSSTTSETQRKTYPLHVLGETITVDSPLQGHHQQRNIALAIAAAIELRNSRELQNLAISNTDSYKSTQNTGISTHDSYNFTPNPPSNLKNPTISNRRSYNITAAAIETGIRTTQWPARLERITGQPNRAEVLLDVAHNPAGAWAVRAALSALLEQRPRPVTLLFGCLKDKAIAEIAQILFPLVDRVVLTQVDSPRAATLEEMKAAAIPTGAEIHIAANSDAALKLAFDLTPNPSHEAPALILVTGSFYLVGAIRTILLSTAPPQETMQEAITTGAS